MEFWWKKMVEKKPVLYLGIIALASLIVNILVYSWAGANGLDADPNFLAYTNIVIVSWASIAAICFFLTMSSLGLKSAPGKVWLFLGLGLTFFAIGDAIYAYLTVVLQLASPFPSVADYIWTLAYPLLFIGIALQLRLAAVKLTKAEIWTVLLTLGLIMAIGVGVVYWLVIPTLEGTTFDYIFFSLDYPLLDLILAPAVVFLALKYKGGEFSRAWAIIAVGFVLMAAFDLLFALLTDTVGSYSLITDHLYIGQYMILAIGAIYLRSSIKGLK